MRAATLKQEILDDFDEPTGYASAHLAWLESEAIHIMREVAAEFANPVMLYSIGKDSSVMLHLAMKAFYPGKPPFPLLHVDTTWKFQEMYAMRERMSRDWFLAGITSSLWRSRQLTQPRTILDRVRRA
jgi:3'-phosphoadenosine 5'-phosphosulfate sulfotransferase (PAPS reductase)/FAD synthetase